MGMRRACGYGRRGFGGGWGGLDWTITGGFLVGGVVYEVSYLLITP